jgi:hypothetical protein
MARRAHSDNPDPAETPLFVHGAGQRARLTSFASASHSQLLLRIFATVAEQGRPLIATRMRRGAASPAVAGEAAPGRTEVRYCSPG